MKILVVILSLFFYPPLTIQDDVKNQVICDIAGGSWIKNYVFNINELPERCDIISVSQYYFDLVLDDGINTHFMEADKSIIRSLVEAKKTVYTPIGFFGEDNWSSIFDPPDACEYMTQIFDPLIKFLTELNVNGILIYTGDIYDNDIEDLAEKISDFASLIKTKLVEVKVGLATYGRSYERFSDKSLFDFTITNKILDIYMIDLTNLNVCGEDTKKIGLNPVTSTMPNMITMDQVTSSVISSSMEKSKIYAMIQVNPIIPIGLVTEGESQISTYSIYCTDQAKSSQWCSNPSNLSYDQGVYAKKFYVGIIINQLDTDDFESNCECDKFPVTNIIIDGWTASPFKACPKLDRC